MYIYKMVNWLKSNDNLHDITYRIYIMLNTGYSDNINRYIYAQKGYIIMLPAPKPEIK